MPRFFSAPLLLLIGLMISYPVTADKAVFAGGCFWCVEAAFQEVDGVSAAISGFTGGTLKKPTYKGNHRGHYEAVEVDFDPAVVSYQQLLDIFWVNIDPFDSGGQFCDRGFSYLSAIFVANEQQQQLATASRAAVAAQFADKKLITPILPASQFWPVEQSHQDYYQKNPLRYRYYRHGCKRDQRLQAIWGDQASH
jgi:peptide-methionine (S)-S-oxide reductase